MRCDEVGMYAIEIFVFPCLDLTVLLLSCTFHGTNSNWKWLSSCPRDMEVHMLIHAW